MWKKHNSCLNYMKIVNQKVSSVVFVLYDIIEHELRSKTVGVNLVQRLNTRLRWVWEFPLCRLKCASSLNSNDFFKS